MTTAQMMEEAGPFRDPYEKLLAVHRAEVRHDSIDTESQTMAGNFAPDVDLSFRRLLSEIDSIGFRIATIPRSLIGIRGMIRWMLLRRLRSNHVRLEKMVISHRPVLETIAQSLFSDALFSLDLADAFLARDAQGLRTVCRSILQRPQTGRFIGRLAIVAECRERWGCDDLSESLMEGILIQIVREAAEHRFDTLVEFLALFPSTNLRLDTAWLERLRFVADQWQKLGFPAPCQMTERERNLLIDSALRLGTLTRERDRKGE